MSIQRHRAARRYIRILLLTLLTAGVAVAFVNTRIDPWRVTPTPWQAKDLDLYRDQTGHLRTAKAGIMRSGTWKVGLVGSSRVANALDPTLPQWGRPDVVNLGCNAAFLREITAIGGHFLAEKSPELMLVGIDPGDLTSEIDTRPLFDFYGSPFYDSGNWDNELRYYFGLSTLDASLATLENRKKRWIAEYGLAGVRQAPPVHRQSQLGFIAETITRITVLETTDAAGPERPLNPQKVADLRKLLEDAATRSCRVIVFFHSCHALMHAEEAHSGAGVIPFEKERRTIVDLAEEVSRQHPGAVTFWDFCNYEPLSCEPLTLDDPKAGRMKYWNDLGHYTTEVGTMMLSLMMDWPLPRPEWAGIGKRIDRSNLEAHLAEIGRGYQRYLSGDGAKDLAWKEDLKAKAGR